MLVLILGPFSWLMASWSLILQQLQQPVLPLTRLLSVCFALGGFLQQWPCSPLTQ